MTCKFTEEEREAWKKGRHTQFDSLEGMLSHVITRLSTSFLYEKDEIDLPAICQSVWSPLSVESMVQELCEPFLKIAALIKFHFFREEFPAKGELTDFQYLCSYLKLNVIDKTVIKPSQLTSAASCVHWIVAEPHTLTRAWCTDLVNFVNNNPTDGKSLLMVNTRWFAPHLIQLPDQYYKIFQAYRKKACQVCSSTPKDPCVCLICGVFLCFRESCCRQQQMYECVHHSVECGAGTGIFLLVNSSIIVVIRGSRAALWGSVYLDEHGEEDRDLKRGKPLYLSNERYSLLESQWIAHSFDHACKRWIWHQDRL